MNKSKRLARLVLNTVEHERLIDANRLAKICHDATDEALDLASFRKAIERLKSINFIEEIGATRQHYRLGKDFKRLFEESTIHIGRRRSEDTMKDRLMSEDVDEAFKVICDQLGDSEDDPGHAYVILTHKQAFNLAWGLKLMRALCEQALEAYPNLHDYAKRNQRDEYINSLL